jgi:hypothetical protein
MVQYSIPTPWLYPALLYIIISAQILLSRVPYVDLYLKIYFFYRFFADMMERTGAVVEGIHLKCKYIQ